MGKKSRAKRPLAAPTRPTGELEGLVAMIQQLIRDRQTEEALRAGQALVENYPLDPLAHAVYGSVLADLRNPSESMRQFELAERLGMGDDPMLLQSLALMASASGFPVHALRAARAGLRLRQAPQQQRELFSGIVTSTEQYVQDLIGEQSLSRSNAEEALLLIERSTRELTNDYERALELATLATRAAPDWPIVWNHLSTVRFGQNQIANTVDDIQRVLQTSGVNSPMLRSTLVRLLEFSGRTDEAEAAFQPLLQLEDPSVSAVEEVAKALAVFGRDQELYERLAPYALQQESPLHPVGMYLFGVAAANIGKPDEARAAWRNLANEGLPQGRIYTDILLRKDTPPTPTGRFTYFAAAEMVPSSVLDELVSRVHPDEDSQRLLEVAATFPYLAEALCETFYAPSVDPRMAVDMLLSLREQRPDVVNAVRTYATSKAPGDHNRLYAHIVLRAMGLEDTRTPSEVWIDGRKRALQLPQFSLANLRPRSYEPAIQRLLEEGGEAQEREDSAAAAAIYRQVLEQDPTIAEAEHNLGTALLLSNNLAEGREHLRRALELDPEYALARCNLASMALLDGDLAGAHALLDPVDARDQFTLEEALAYLRTRADLAHAEGDVATAEAYLYALLSLDPDSALAKERLAALAAQPAV